MARTISLRSFRFVPARRLSAMSVPSIKSSSLVSGPRYAGIAVLAGADGGFSGPT